MMFNHWKNFAVFRKQTPLMVPTILIHIGVKIKTYSPMILEDMDVLAALMMQLFPSSSTFTVRCS